MICSKCGAKLRVVETAQHKIRKGVEITRVRVCDDCNSRYLSKEKVFGAKIAKEYTHNQKKRRR